MKHEDHYELRYQVPTAGGNWSEKVIRFKTVEKKEKSPLPAKVSQEI